MKTSNWPAHVELDDCQLKKMWQKKQKLSEHVTGKIDNLSWIIYMYDRDVYLLDT